MKQNIRPDDEFYIGYLSTAPPGYTRHTRLVVWVLAALLVITGLLLALSQQGFSTAVYEDKEVILKGIVYKNPVPVLKVLEGSNEKGESVAGQTLLLVGSGKFGAATALEKYEKATGKPLDNLFVSVKGNLMHHQGKTVMQLVNEEKSFLSSSLLPHPPPRPVRNLGNIQVQGEIIDPKCYFGTMKPGCSKIHRSCAIRCMEGGIPPVLAVRESDEKISFYLLLYPHQTTDRLPDHTRFSAFVGDLVQAQGTLWQYGDWQAIEVNAETGIRLADPLTTALLSKITICKPHSSYEKTAE